MNIRSWYQRYLLLAPFAIVAAVFQWHFQQFLPFQSRFKGPEFFDFLSVLDLYIIGLVLFFGLCLAQKRLPQKVKVFPLELIFGFGLLLLAGVLELFFQTAYGPALTTPILYFRTMVVFPVIFFLIFLRSCEDITIEKLRLSFLGALSFMGALSLFQYFTGFFPGTITDFTDRLVWPYVDFLDMKAQSANWLAFMMLPGFLLSFGVLFLEYQKGLRRRRTEGAWSIFSNLVAVITFIITGLVLLLVQSYGSFLGLGVVVILLLFRNLPLKKFLVALGVLIVLGGGYFWYQKDSAKYKIITNEVVHKYVNSVDARGDIWKMNISTVQKNWVLGVGLNQYQNYFRLFHHEVLGKSFLEEHIPPHPHNFFLGFWLNLGIVGLVGILFILGGMFYRFALEKENLAMFVMIGILLHGMVDIYYWKQEIVYVFWMVILFAYLRPKH